MRQFLSLVVLGTLFTASSGITSAKADDSVADAPAIVETGPGASKILVKCTADQMPVMTEGPTEEIQAGKVTHYDHGILKCVEITEKVRIGEAGGSGTASFSDGRKLEVVNCPKGTSPFVLELNDFNNSTSITYDPKKPLPSEYVALAPVTVRCMETALVQQAN
jgi:hypothetical protein